MPDTSPQPAPRKLVDRVARRRAVAEAGHAGDEASARPALADPDPSVRATALGALARMGALTDADLTRGAADDDPGLRRRVAELIGAKAKAKAKAKDKDKDKADTDADAGAGPDADPDPDRVGAILTALLADAEPSVIETAAWATGEVFGASTGDDDRGDPDDAALATRPPPDPPSASADGTDHERTADPANGTDNTDGTGGTERTADPADGPRTWTTDPADDPADDPGAAATDGRARAMTARLSELARGHDDALVREAAVAALGAIGDHTGLAAILAATTDKATVRRRAIIALAPFDGPDVHAALTRARDDRDWQVRQAAEDLLAFDDPDGAD